MPHASAALFSETNRDQSSTWGGGHRPSALWYDHRCRPSRQRLPLDVRGAQLLRHVYRIESHSLYSVFLVLCCCRPNVSRPDGDFTAGFREVHRRILREMRGRQGAPGCGLEPNTAVRLPHRASCLFPQLVVL